MALNLLFLLSCVLVLANVQRTARASVGTMRWRIKFMIVGLGVLFAVSAYTSSQNLLFGIVEYFLGHRGLRSAPGGVPADLALAVAGRTFDVTVYPSQSALYNSLTMLLAGVYLFVVGVLAKVVTFLGGDATSGEGVRHPGRAGVADSPAPVRAGAATDETLCQSSSSTTVA